jgi:hypothetical protein
MRPSIAILEPLMSRIRLSPARLTMDTVVPARSPRLERNFLVSSLPVILSTTALSPILQKVMGSPGTAPDVQDLPQGSASMSIIIFRNN